MLWYDEVVRVQDVALWVRERKSEGADKGERRSVPLELPARLQPSFLRYTWRRRSFKG